MRAFAAMVLGLSLSVAACAIVGEDTESSGDAFSFGRGRPGNGRRPGEPVHAPEEDASAPPAANDVDADTDAAPPVPEIVADEDAEAPPPVVEEDAGPAEPPPLEPPPSDEDAG